MRYLLFFLGFLILLSCGGKNRQFDKAVTITKELGYDTKAYQVVYGQVQSGDTFGSILDTHHILPGRVLRITKTIKKVFDARKIRLGAKYAVVIPRKDSLARAVAMFYFKKDQRYFKIDFATDENIKAVFHDKPMEAPIVKSTAAQVQTVDDAPSRESKKEEKTDDERVDKKVTTENQASESFYIGLIKPVLDLGYDTQQYDVIRGKVKKGDTFGNILDSHHIKPARVVRIAKGIKKVFDTRKIRLGIKYAVVVPKNDSLSRAIAMFYFNDKARYTEIDLVKEQAVLHQKPVKKVLRKVSGVIESSLSQALDEKHVPPQITIKLADDIYAWTIDFKRLDKGDRFKLIYEQHYVDDTVSVGVGRIKAAMFDHRKHALYAFVHTKRGRDDYFDEEGFSLRRAFLKAPIKFKYRISSRYNLKRRIAYYGRVKPHKGTDFAAPIGTPIVATADGKVIESRRKGGNGHYVKIRHNATYSTQYLHMRRRKARVGQYVRQGDVIGWIGMTGNTSGPHVCYRFWKNGKQVDPFKQKIPRTKRLRGKERTTYLANIKPEKKALDAIPFAD